MPGSRIVVFHIMLIPIGAFIAVVTSDGSLPCATAVAAYRMNQANWAWSAGFPATVAVDGWAQSCQGSTTAGSQARRSAAAGAAASASAGSTAEVTGTLPQAAGAGAG